LPGCIRGCVWPWPLGPHSNRLPRFV
jgi:hypothetical protein